MGFGIGSFLSNIGVGHVFSGAARLVGGILGRNAARQDYEDQVGTSWEMWNAQNAYNHPAAQMARYRAAGLNPHLIYGQQNLAAPIHVPSGLNSGSYLSNGFSDFGDSIDKGISSYMQADERRRNEMLAEQTLQANEFKLSSARTMFGYELEQNKLMNERARLQNELLRQQISHSQGPSVDRGENPGGGLLDGLIDLFVPRSVQRTARSVRDNYIGGIWKLARERARSVSGYDDRHRYPNLFTIGGSSWSPI